MAGEPTLTRGERGDWVNYLKQLLDYHEVRTEDRDDDLEDDDEYGRKTARAIRKFQRFHGLESTGQVDEETWRLLADAPDPERRPPGAGDDEDDDNDDDDDDDYRERRRARDGGDDRRSRDRDDDDDDERGGGRSRSTRGGDDKDDDKDKEEEPGTVGALLDSVASEFGIDMDWSKFGQGGEEEEETPKLELVDEPWMEEGSLNWRVKNRGKGKSSYYSIWVQVVDANNSDTPMLYMDYQNSTDIDAGEDIVESLALDEFNRQAEDQRSQFDQFGRYRFEVAIGTDEGWSETRSVQFECNMADSSSDGEESEEGEEREDFKRVESFRYP